VDVLTVLLAATLFLLPLQVAAPALPAEIPLFPLPETTLFPGVSRPLLIYEPRYREMVADALKATRSSGWCACALGSRRTTRGARRFTPSGAPAGSRSTSSYRTGGTSSCCKA
jgi:hypothetical protein